MGEALVGTREEPQEILRGTLGETLDMIELGVLLDKSAAVDEIGWSLPEV